MEEQLEETFQDMKRRLKENDPQLKAGFKKFIKCYNKMTRTKTTALLTSAFHCFGSRSGGFAITLCGGRRRWGPNPNPGHSCRKEKDWNPREGHNT